MTHERLPDLEAPDGPEHDDSLPDATSVPVADGPDELPPIDWVTDDGHPVEGGEGLDVEKGAEL